MNQQALFGTPLLCTQVDGTDALHEALRELLLEEARTVPSRQHSNVGGWHSAQDLLQRKAPPFQSLTALLVHQFQDGVRQLAGALASTVRVGGQGWAMVMENGHHTLPHHHGDAHFACVYYIDAGDPPPPTDPDAGALVLMDPRGAVTAGPLDLYPPVHALHPTSGMFVMFPGHVLHFVRPYIGQRPRISVAVNFVLQ